MRRAFLFTFSVMLVAGCATTRMPQAILPVFPYGEDGVEILATRPPLPARLQPGERLEFDLAYQLSTADGALLYVQPHTGGRQSRNYIGHAPIECKPGYHTAEAWISFRGPARVDEVRIMVIGAEQRVPLAVVTNAVDAAWESTD